MKKDTTGRNTSANKNKDTAPIKNKEQVQQSNDPKIDQDFEGFPHGTATEAAIKTNKKVILKK